MKHALLLFGAAACAVANAQTSLSDSVSARERTLESAQVVATRAGNQTPVAFSNLSKKDIAETNFGPDLPYLLTSTPSVTVAGDAGAGIGYTYLRIRGTDPTRINITANGIPLNDAESNSIYWVNMGDFASSVGSVQVQRGVGTSTIGSGAFGGNVNMQTESIADEPFAELAGSVGSFGTHKETLRFGTGRLGGHWKVGGRLSNIGSDGYIDRASTDLNSYFLQGGYFGDKTTVKFITFNGKEETYHAWDYATHAQMQEYGRTYNPSGKYTDSDGNTQFYKNQIDNYHQQHYQLLWNQTLTDALTLTSALHYTRGKGYYEQYKTSRKLYQYGLESALGAKSDLVRRKYSEADFYGTTLALLYKKGRWDAAVGGAWNKYDGRHYGKVLWVREFQGAIDPLQEYYRNYAHKKDLNVYARASVEVARGLSVYGDAQYRRVKYRMYGPTDEFNGPGDQIEFDFDNTFDFFNPKAGLFYRRGAHSAYASWGMGHKEPTRNDYEAALWTQEPKSETLNDLEAGYKWESARFSAGVNFYYMFYKNQFVLTGEQDQNGEFIARNVGKSYRRGVELTAAWRPTDWLTWDANLTWSHNRVQDYTMELDDTGEAYNLGNTPISYSPNVIWNNIFSVKKGGFIGRFGTHFVGRQFMTNTGFENFEQEGETIELTLKNYCLSNLDLAYQFSDLRFCKEITVGVSVYNIFNKKYEANGAAAVCLKSDGKGGAMAYQDDDWNSYAVYSAQATANFLVHASIKF